MKLRKLFTLLSISLCPSLQVMAQIPAQLEQKLQDTLNYMQSHYRTMGISAAVSVKGQGLWNGTAGLSEPGLPLTKDMLIGIGSNTKTFVSTLMLQLEEQGQISLDDSIGNWIQDYPNISGTITVKQILNHTSGLFSYTEDADLWDSLMANPFRIWTKEEILQNFVQAPVFTPGTSWEYSNTNYVIAGIILEAVTGKPVYTLIRDSILSPLQMTHTFFPPDETPTYDLAGFWTDGGQYGLPFESYSLPNTAGALVSNPEDVVHFWEGLFNGALIGKNTLNNKMLEMAVNSPDNKYGYGLGIFKDNYFDNNGYSHGGTWLGQINSNFIDTVRGITICVLSNQDSLSNDYTEAVVAALYKVYLNTTTTGIKVNELQPLTALFYPNPAMDILYLQQDGNYSGKRTVTIRSVEGTIRIQKQFPPSEKIQVGLQQLPAGLYIAEVSDEKGNTGSRNITVVR